MAFLSRNRGLVIGVGTVAAVVGAEVLGYGPFSNSSGVKNIENRYSAGGGSTNHLPGYASPRGDPSQVVGRSEKQQGHGNPEFRKQVNEQRLTTNENVIVTRKQREDRDTPGKDADTSSKK